MTSILVGADLEKISGQTPNAEVGVAKLTREDVPTDVLQAGAQLLGKQLRAVDSQPGASILAHKFLTAL